MNLFITKTPEERVSMARAIFNALLLTAIIVAVFWYALAQINVTFQFGFLLDYRKRLLDGFLNTIWISAGSLVLSLILGVLAAVGQSSRVLMLRYLARGYVTFIRGTPLIMQIYLFYYIVGTAFGIDNRYLCGVLIMSVFEGAYVSEIIRGSLLSIDRTQLEAARAVGFTRRQTIRFVILPQLMARTLPGLTGQFASIIKDSSLLSMISVIELTQSIREITSINLKLFESYLFLGILYLVLTLPITIISKRLERRFSYE